MVGNNNKKVGLLVFAVFAIVIATVGASFAFFTYSRTGTQINKIQMGNIEFSMLDGDSVVISDAFPESDTKGNSRDGYTFTVNNTSSEGLTLSYNVGFLTNNTDLAKNYFTNDQVKYSLTKNDAYVAGTSSTSGNKLSTVTGFEGTATTGNGDVLLNQLIAAGTTDTYELRIWISDDVSYSGTIDGNGLMTGVYNEYEYSLKVKVTAVNQ